MTKQMKQKTQRAGAVEKMEEDSVRKNIRISWKEGILLGMIVVFAALVAVYIIAGRTDTGGRARLAMVGDSAPEFSLPGLNGGQASLSAYKGRVVMVHFWATWCPPCVEEMPSLERLYKSFPGGAFEILGVNVDEGGPVTVSSFIQRHGVSFPILLDPQRSIPTMYGTFKFPESYIIDREGVVREKIIGPRDWNEPANSDLVRRMLEKS